MTVQAVFAGPDHDHPGLAILRRLLRKLRRIGHPTVDRHDGGGVRRRCLSVGFGPCLLLDRDRGSTVEQDARFQCQPAGTGTKGIGRP